MAIIVDADVVIRGEKGTFDFRDWVSSLPKEEFALAAITVAELWHGVERATVAHRQKREAYLRTILDRMPVIPFTEQTAYQHARIWAALGSSGRMIGFYYLIVAATAAERKSQVATFNKQHFSRVPGLKVIEPRSP
jgi:predicted nucleic acid-binding protein